MKFPLSKFPIMLLLLSACALDHEPPPPPKPLPPAPPVIAQRQEITPPGVVTPQTPTVKVALLVPLSGDSAAVGSAMLDAATMAISDSYLTTPTNQIHAQVILMPKDTGGTPAQAASAADAVIAQGATFIIGPLFSQSVGSVQPIAAAHHIDLLTFSNNRAVAGSGAFVFGFLPEQQIARMADYAYMHNLQRVAVLAPNDSYGQKVKTTLLDSYAPKGGVVSPIELYAPTAANIDAAVGRLAAGYAAVPEERRFQALFIADGGYQLKNILDSMKKYHLDPTKIKLLGTGLWDDPSIAKLPEMAGAWFPSSPPEPYRIFERHFVATYGYKPVRLASLAYDAVMLVSGVAMPGQGINSGALVNPQGFNSPANGLFRLHPNGLSERRLAIMEITPDGFTVIDPAQKGF